uniref:Uncharacterized protein n=1 Tax=viral metagenome TaxID=1070528 RepID=A0A6C0H5S9_9ZZZZ
MDKRQFTNNKDLFELIIDILEYYKDIDYFQPNNPIYYRWVNSFDDIESNEFKYFCYTKLILIKSNLHNFNDDIVVIFVLFEILYHNNDITKINPNYHQLFYYDNNFCYHDKLLIAILNYENISHDHLNYNDDNYFHQLNHLIKINNINIFHKKYGYIYVFFIKKENKKNIIIQYNEHNYKYVTLNYKQNIFYVKDIINLFYFVQSDIFYGD